MVVSQPKMQYLPQTEQMAEFQSAQIYKVLQQTTQSTLKSSVITFTKTKETLTKTKETSRRFSIQLSSVVDVLSSHVSQGMKISPVLLYKEQAHK